jgi:hypothetical protein
VGSTGKVVIREAGVPPEVVELIRAVAAHLPEAVGRVLVQQAEHASVEAETPGRLIDLVVAAPVPDLHLPDGPLRPIPSVLDETGVIIGEVIIWVEGGRLTGVERPWFTDDAPALWPDVATLDFDER